MSLGLNRETLSRKPPSRLAEFLAESEGPLGSLTLGGDDLGRLIRDETDSTVLRSALERVRRVHDTRWVIEIERRLLALKLEPELAMQHIATLLRAHSIEEAAVTLGRIKRRSVSPASYLDAGARIALQMNDFEPVRSALSQPDVLGRQAHRSLYIDFLRRLLGAGDIAAFSIEFGIAQIDFADDPALATLAVQIVAMRDGPEAAEGYLESQLNLLPRNSATAMRLKAGLLLERGRYRECFEFTTSRIAKDPGKLTLYPLAADAARHSNGIEVVARLVETAAVIFPQSLEVQVMRCGLAAEQSEFEKAEGLLPRILENSDWAYRRALLDVACQQPGVDRAIAAYEDCRTVGIRSGGPEINLSNYLYFYHAAAGGLSRARSLLEPLVASRVNDSAFLRTYFRILTALGAEKECRRAFEQLPQGVKMTDALRPFAAFFHAQDMQHDEARKIWRDQLAAAAPVAINAASSYPRTIRLRYKDRPGAVLAFLTIFNGIEFVDWFLDYYRNLGVDHFFAVDNGSDDGTFERLLAAEDVSVFRNLGSFAQSGFGVFWINYLLRRFGVDHWCFHLDMDEAFVFPGMERGRRLSDLLGYLDSRGHQSVPAVMLDIYPDQLADLTDGFVGSTFIDTDYFSMPCEIPPYRFVQGGIRARLSGRGLLMTKAPLVKMQPDLCYLATNHQHTHVPVSDLSAALLHYKFIGKAMRRIDEAIDRNEHFMGARFYRSLKEPLLSASGGKSLLSEHSVRYEGPLQLVELGLMNSTTEWGNFGE